MHLITSMLVRMHTFLSLIFFYFTYKQSVGLMSDFIVAGAWLKFSKEGWLHVHWQTCSIHIYIYKTVNFSYSLRHSVVDSVCVLTRNRLVVWYKRVRELSEGGLKDQSEVSPFLSFLSLGNRKHSQHLSISATWLQYRQAHCQRQKGGWRW